MKSRGFTIIELLIVISIGLIIVGLTATVFVNFINFQSVDKDTDSAVSYVNKARGLSINSSNFNEYGIRFATTSIKIFEGKTFSVASTTLVFNLSSRVVISSIHLSNGGTDIYFNKLTGKPNATGTVIFKSITGTTTKNLILYDSGLSEPQ